MHYNLCCKSYYYSQSGEIDRYFPMGDRAAIFVIIIYFENLKAESNTRVLYPAMDTGYRHDVFICLWFCDL